MTAIPDGTYLWNCLAYDNLSNSAFASNNYTITIEATAPDVNITINDSYLEYGLDSVLIDFNASDINFDSVVANVTYPNTTLLHQFTNQSFTNQSFNFTFGPAELNATGTYTVTLFANDTYGNVNILTDTFEVAVQKWSGMRRPNR